MIILPDGTVEKTNREQLERMREVIRLARWEKQPVYLNPAEELQGEYIKDLFGGLSEQFFPGTYRAFEETCCRASQNLDEVIGADVVEGWQDHVFVNQFSMSDDGQYLEVASTATAADFFIQMSLHMDVYAYGEDGEPWPVGVARSQFVYPMEHTVSTSCKVKRDFVEKKKIGVLLSVCKITQEGVLKCYVTANDLGECAASDLIRNVVVTHPAHQPGSGFMPEDPIVVCFCRTPTVQDKYDYLLGSLNDISFYIPCKGCVEFSDSTVRFASVDKDNTSLSLIRVESGGGIPFSYPEQFPEIFKDNKESLEYEKNGFFWDFKNRGWVKEKPIPWMEQVNTLFCLNVTFYVENDKEPKTFILSNTSSPQKVNPIHLYWGCLYRDTLISMADGSGKKIQNITVGEMVKGREDALRVSNVWMGKELQGIYRIKTDSGHQVLATAHHPFMTEMGLKMVTQLKPCINNGNYVSGDSIYTENGVYENVIEVFLEEVSDMTVYNLELERTDGAELLPENALIFANGLLAGDQNAQGYVIEKHRREIEERYGIPDEWMKDMDSAQKFFHWN